MLCSHITPLILAIGWALSPADAEAQSDGTPIRAVEVHPILAERFHCSEHPAGELPYLGDALGADCTILRQGRLYTGDGSTNEEFHVWGRTVLSPMDGTVVRVHINPVTNTPGVIGEPPASTIVVERADGVHVIIAHINDPTVEVGDSVVAGQEIARVGNNGMSTGPHLHIGAWQDEEPLQIRWDLRAVAALRAR